MDTASQQALLRELLIDRSPHPPEFEALISRAVHYYTVRNQVLVQHLRHHRGQRSKHAPRATMSHAWRSADHAYRAAEGMLAAYVGAAYRAHNPDPVDPVDAVADLILSRVGSLCTGWPEKDLIAHHPSSTCPVHEAKELDVQQHVPTPGWV